MSIAFTVGVHECTPAASARLVIGVVGWTAPRCASEQHGQWATIVSNLARMTRTGDRFRTTVAAVIAAAIGLAGCSGSESPDDAGPIRVSAAASLTRAFEQIGDEFEKTHDAEVVFSFNGSNVLATQMIEGAPVDVFASADTESMQTVVDAGVVLTPETFATNRLAIMVQPGNPNDVETLDDLSGLDVALCAAEVPCGRYAKRVLAAADVELVPVSLDANVNGVATKVQLQEVDAGLVYSTNIADAGQLAEGVEIADEFNVVAEYPIATVGESPSDAAVEFVEFVMSETGQQILAESGFGPP